MDVRLRDPFISFFPSRKALKYWQSRWEAAVKAKSGLLAQGLALVLLNNEYQVHERFRESTLSLSSFEELVGESAMKELQRAINAGDVADRALGYQEYKEAILAKVLSAQPIDPEENAEEERKGMENSILFLTTLYVAGKGNLALSRTDTSNSWEYMSWSKLAHWLAGQYLRSQSKIDSRLANCMRINLARFMFNCAVRKDIYEYHFLVKSFQYFEGMIERNIQKKKLIRRSDSEIVPSQQSVAAILNMAACFLELRNLKRGQVLVQKAENLIALSSERGSSSMVYLEAYARYVKGLIYFEETSPLRGVLNGAVGAYLSASELKQKYESSAKFLTLSATVLKEKYPSSPLTASALTMLAVVSANNAADFTDEVLTRLKEALEFESQHETRTVTATYLYQMLRRSVASERSSTKKFQQCQVLFKAAESLIGLNYGNTAPNKLVQEAPMEIYGPADDNGDDLSLSSAQSSEQYETSDIFRAIKYSRHFLDGRRQASLAHFKKLLSLCCKDADLTTRILCYLFISRHHIKSQYLKKAASKNDKASRLLRNIFGINLESLNKLDANKLRDSHPVIHKELSFLISFWLINNALLILGEADLAGQKEAASRVEKMINLPRDRNLTSVSQLAVLATQKFAYTWSKAKRQLNHARKALKNAKSVLQCLKSIVGIEETERPAFAFLAEYMADAFYSFNDQISFDDRYKNDPQLVFSVVDFLKEADDLKQNPAGLEESTSVDLVHFLNSMSINMPGLSRYMQRLPVNKEGVRVMGKFQNLEVILTVSNVPAKLKMLQSAYDTCKLSDLFDTELHAEVHFHAGLELMRGAYMDPFKPHYPNFNAAILKFRKAARIFERLYGDDARTARCYAILSLLYCHQVQLEDQESKCLSCLEKCVNIETRLVAKESNPSPWVWKCLEVIRDGKAYFKQLSVPSGKKKSFHAEDDQWTQLFRKFQTALKREVPYCTMVPVSNNFCQPSSLLADELFDPLEEWEEKRNRSLKAIAVMMWDREFPKDSPPSDTEIRCYAQYLTKLFNRHWHFCPVPQGLKPEERCQLDNLEGSPDEVIRNHFLEGLSGYSTSSAEDKIRILKRLQRNHNLLLTKCNQAIRCHDAYQVAC